ncbi:MAG: AAA family ATPase, partial [Candidatus Micrarchaeaceae archaeon]
MKLQTVHVTNFRSAEDSEVFETGQVTCLVGKNEAGKSAILLALAALNPHPATPAVLDRERDYPRRSLTQYDQKHPADSPAVAITTTWKLDKTDVVKITESVGRGVLSSDIVTASRAYGKDIEIEASIDYTAALDFLYSKFALDASECSALGSVETTSALIDALSKLGSPTAKHQQLQAYLSQHGAVTGQVHTFIRGLLPKFMYFAAYDRMTGAIQIEQIKSIIANGQI